MTFRGISSFEILTSDGMNYCLEAAIITIFMRVLGRGAEYGGGCGRSRAGSACPDGPHLQVDIRSYDIRSSDIRASEIRSYGSRPCNIQPRGRWGTPTAAALPIALKNAFQRAIQHDSEETR